MDVATLAIKVENGDVVKATTSLNNLTVAGGKSEAATQRLTRRMALLEIEARNMDATMGRGKLSIESIAMSMGATEVAAGALSKALAGLSVLAAIGFIGKKTIEETEAAQSAMAQLEAGVRSTGGAAGRTVQQLDELSMALQKTTTFSDETVKGAEAILLTFDKIKGENFDRATAAVTDLSTRMGGDLQAAAVQVGKALQDPEHGLTALRRTGITFSESQVEVIKQLYETGRAAQGQIVILKELEHQVGGSAAAERDTLGGALKGLKNVWGDLFEVTKGASQGTVTAINAITHAIETSGLSMNTVLHDATVDWETMRASIEKVRAILSLQIDGKFLENARNIIQRIDFDLNAKIAAMNAPAKLGSEDGKGKDDEESKRQAKFREELAHRDLEIAKQRALNAVIGASSATIALLNNAYDARAERAKNAIDHTAAETAALNKRTNAMLAAKDAAVLEAQAQANRKQVTDVQHSDANAVRDARQALELAGLSDEAAAQRRVDMQAENDLAAARYRFALMTKDLDKERADIAAGILQREQDIYASTAKRVEAVRQIGHETAAVSAEMDRQKKAAEEVARTIERRWREAARVLSAAINGVFTDILNKKNPFQAIWDNAKAGFFKMVSDIIASKIIDKFKEMMGVGETAAAKKQDEAGRKMVDASQRQLRAAELMAGVAHSEGNATGERKEPSWWQKLEARMPQWLSKSIEFVKQAAAPALAGFGVGYGVGQSTFSTSHGTFGNYARGALGGAAAGAVAGSAFGPVGTVVGAVAGFVGGIVGMNKAMKEMAAQVTAATKAVALSLDALKARNSHDTLAGAIAQVEAERETLRKAIEDAWSGGDANSDRVQWRTQKLKEMNAAQDQYIAQLKEEAAAKSRYFTEDLDVRALRAQGKDKAADALDFQHKQDRELDDYRRTHDIVNNATDAAQYAYLQQVLALEANRRALDANTAALTTTTRNAPTGFKLDGYIQEFAKGSPYPAQPGQWTPPQSPNFTQSQTTTGTVATAPVVFNAGAIQITGTDLSADEIADAFVRKLDERRGTTGGINMTRGQALELMKTTTPVLRS